jgi:hypothetical protein
MIHIYQNYCCIHYQNHKHKYTVDSHDGRSSIINALELRIVIVDQGGIEHHPKY